MTAWLLGGTDPESVHPLKATKYHFHAAARNEGTGEATGGSPVAIATWDLEVSGTKSTVKLVALVQAHRPRIDFFAKIDWREIGDEEAGIPGLRIEFESLVDSVSARYETPYGTVSRPAEPDLDVPSLRYASITDVQGGYTLVQDGKYGHEHYQSGDLTLRVVRSSFDPDHAPEVAKSELRYAIVLHDSEPSAADLARLGAEENHPLIVFPATLQEGPLPASKSYARVLTPEVTLAGLKPAEDGGVILRLVNYASTDIAAEAQIDAALGDTPQLVDLMERPIDGDVTLANGLLKVTIPANSFVTVKL